MRVGLLWERKADFPFSTGLPADIRSELLAEFEEDELLGGLQDAGFEVVRIGGARTLVNRIGYWRKRCDIVFNRSVGYQGVERKVYAAAVLDAAGIPYVGSTPYVLALTRHKYHAKLVVADAGIDTPPSVVVAGSADLSLEALPFPAIIKPLAESSSIGISREASLVHTPSAAILQAKTLVSAYRQPALVETFVAGAEVEVPVFIDPEPRALGIVAITLEGRPIEGEAFLSSDAVFSDRYGFGDPPTYVDSTRVMRAAEAGARALGIRDYGRMDFRVTTDGTPWFIEASTHPHIQQHSSFNFLAQRSGRNYDAMLAEVVAVAVRRLRLDVR